MVSKLRWSLKNIDGFQTKMEPLNIDGFQTKMEP